MANHSFELQPHGWTNLFSVDIPVPEDMPNRADEFREDLEDISENVLKIIGNINHEKDKDALPMQIRLTGGDETINKIVGDIGDVGTALENLKGEVESETTKVLGMIENVGSNGVLTENENENENGFRQKLERYKKLKRTSDTAVEKYNQQMNSHVISLSTNLAILAGAVGILYMSAKKK